jgi:hypothetical protein
MGCVALKQERLAIRAKDRDEVTALTDVVFAREANVLAAKWRRAHVQRGIAVRVRYQRGRIRTMQIHTRRRGMVSRKGGAMRPPQKAARSRPAWRDETGRYRT